MDEWGVGLFALAGVIVGGIGNWLLSRWQHQENLRATRRAAEQELLSSLLFALADAVEAYTNVAAATQEDQVESARALGPALRRQMILAEQVQAEAVRELARELHDEILHVFDMKPIGRREAEQVKQAEEHGQKVGLLFQRATREIGARLRET